MTHGPTCYSRPSRPDLTPVIQRLRSTAECSPELAKEILALGSRVESQPVKTILQVEGLPVRRPRYLITGWACRYRHLSDGRRQIFDFVLPGEGVGVSLRPALLANTNTLALTNVRLVDAGSLLQPETLSAHPELLPALQARADADEQRALDQIVRLGRLTALERLTHFILEIHERLEVVGLAPGDRFQFPITQETLADATGLSVVHVNRTLQELRRQNLMSVERGEVQLLDRETMARIADREPSSARSAAL